MSRGRALAAAGWTLAAGLLAAHLVLVEPPAERGARSGLRLLIGPFTDLAVDVQWIRFRSALSEGRVARALAHAETAIELDPASPLSYDLLASYLAFDLASATREPDPARRRAWLEAGLAVAARGEARTDAAAELAYLQGLILQVRAETDPEVGWPNGEAGLLRDAESHYARAAALGHAEARVAATYLRTRR